MDRKSDRLAITISKFNRGSLTKQEIEDVSVFFQQRFYLSKM